MLRSPRCACPTDKRVLCMAAGQQGANWQLMSKPRPMPSRRAAMLLCPLLFVGGRERVAHGALVDEDVATRVYESSFGSVVTIVNTRSDRTGRDVVSGVGSGVVWDAAGHVVTNYRCISKLDKDSDELRVVLSGSNGVPLATYPARLLATDTLTDLAVLVVEAAAALQPARMGTSADLVVGQSVFAIGSPAGLPRSLTAGVVSGVGRSIPSPVGTLIYGAIQTDASITVSSSGGPLLDSSARVVGINSAAYTGTGSGRGSGINFALPIDLAMKVVPQLIVNGNAQGRRV
ncbi:trypsin-like cysteine/serine peptidase domain-containing protein [Haematococcus lacustris]